MSKCDRLTKIENEKQSLKRNASYELNNFVEKWVAKAKEENDSIAKFIFLWIGVNAWASMSVLDNRTDKILIIAMAADKILQTRFNDLMQSNKDFKGKVDELISLSPVFDVRSLSNNKIKQWDGKNRPQYIQKIKEVNPNIKTAPECAFEHLDKKEIIPSDWPHIIHIIYQIRCNLFHGGKSHINENDIKFVELAYYILWNMIQEEFGFEK